LRRTDTDPLYSNRPRRYSTSPGVPGVGNVGNVGNTGGRPECVMREIFRLEASALAKNFPPLLSKNDPGSLNGLRRGAAARCDDESRCPRPGSGRVPFAVIGSVPTHEWGRANMPAASQSAKRHGRKKTPSQGGAQRIRIMPQPTGSCSGTRRNKSQSHCACQPR